jgi:hypothetical protein
MEIELLATDGRRWAQTRNRLKNENSPFGLTACIRAAIAFILRHAPIGTEAHA